MSDPPATEKQTAELALADALSAVLLPLARLAIAHGLHYSSAAELFKRAFVEAAREAQPEPAAQRLVSRISTATGISRREVARLSAAGGRRAARSRSHVAELFAHWITAPPFRDRKGAPRTLPRQGGEASFEALAQSITRDVHPRSLLDELVRLGLATHDAEHDTVTLKRDTFVPRGDAQRLLGFLADNVGDHACAAVHNVLNPDRPHFEQAIFANELSTEALDAARALVRAQWQALVDALVPALEDMIEDDRRLGRPPDRRLRIGLYSYHQAADAEAPAPASVQPGRGRRRQTQEPEQ